MNTLYPDIEPHASGHLRVSGVHEVYWEECGNPEGKPVVYLHGGPGAACNAKHRRYFDPEAYRIVLFDQRGCGRSRPHACLEQNTTRDLIADIEALREMLGIERWQVFGGSWGSTLALAYAEAHAERTTELVLRGIFTFMQDEVDWLTRHGTSVLFPESWERLTAILDADERGDVIEAYYGRLTGNDEAKKLEAALTWSGYEFGLIALRPDPESFALSQDEDYAIALSRIECHYMVNGGFLRDERQLLDGAHLLASIPTVIVHGRYDVICPVRNAWRLAKTMPHARLDIVADAGHSAAEPGIIDRLIAATDEFARV